MKLIHPVGLLLLSCISLLCANMPVRADLRREAEALVNWKASLASADGSLGSWSLANSTSLCWWSCITCDPEAGHIAELDLRDVSLNGTLDELDFSAFPHLKKLNLVRNGLHGTIPAGIGNLTSLVELYITGSLYLRGAIPRSIGQLKHLTVLVLEALGLNGTLPEEISNLTSLEELTLNSIALTGSIPRTIGMLTKLRSLSLGSNSLTGSIPIDIGNMTSLVMLEITDNPYLRGAFPRNIGQLKHLAILGLKALRLDGTLPEEVGNLTRLEELSLNSIALTGSIPRTIGMLTKLRWLDLSNNNLTGSIPLEIGNMTELQRIDFSGNYLEGQLLGTISHLIQLQYLDLSGNQLGGHIAPELGNSSFLYEVYIADNNFSGPFPSSICAGRVLFTVSAEYNGFTSIIQQTFQNCTTLQHVDFTANNIVAELRDCFGEHPGWLEFMAFSQNQLYGTLLTEQGEIFLCNSTYLGFLDLANNALHGSLSECIGDLPSLVFMDLSRNFFNGVVPFSCKDSLKYLYLDTNHFGGTFPLGLQKCKNLITLDLGGNDFLGTIPSWISTSLPELKFLRLSSNMFDGIIPYQILQFRQLQLLDLSNNKLTGPIPDDFTNLTGMIQVQETTDGLYIPGGDREVIEIVWKNTVRTYNLYWKGAVVGIDLSCNSLSQEIPDGFTTLLALRFLNLSGNHLSGSIPQDFGNLVLLESLDLSQNQLSGGIPPSFAALKSMGVLNLSYNGLSGRIPTGSQLQTLVDPSIYSHNPGLCGFPLQDCVNSSTSTQNEVGQAGDREVLWLYCFVAAGFISGFWLYWGMFLFYSETWRCAFYQYVDNMQVKVTKKIYRFMPCFQDRGP